MLSGTIAIRSMAPSDVLVTHLAGALTSVKARSIAVQADRITFTGGLNRLVNRWNVLVPFYRCELVISPTAVTYRLGITQLLYGVTLGVGFLCVGSLIMKEPRMLFFAPISWAWLVGMNLAIGLSRFRTFLRRSIAEAGFEVMSGEAATDDPR